MVEGSNSLQQRHWLGVSKTKEDYPMAIRWACFQPWRIWTLQSILYAHRHQYMYIKHKTTRLQTTASKWGYESMKRTTTRTTFSELTIDIFAKKYNSLSFSYNKLMCTFSLILTLNWLKLNNRTFLQVTSNLCVKF